MYKICFYVPASHLDIVKQAMFDEGAGKIGQYSSCAWQVLGEGQFMPLAESKPFIGQQGQVEKVSEYKVEMICHEKYIDRVICAFKKAHPYEQPAYDIMRLENIISL